MFYLIITGIVFLVIYVFYRKIRINTRGTDLGFRTVRLGDPGFKERQRRYIRGATATEREQWQKLDRKARKTRWSKKKIRLLNQSAIWRVREENARKTALEFLKPESKAKGHGIRRSGSERGRLMK